MSDLTAASVKAALAAVSSAAKAKDLAWFFKTGPGEYGEGDKFIGVTVPQSRAVAAKFAGLPTADIYELAQSEFHEHRHCAMVLIVNQFKRAKLQSTRDELFDLWMRLLDEGRINNWDLVDVSAPYIGTWWFDKPDAIARLLKLAESEDLWHRRASIIFTFAFIRNGDCEPTWRLAEKLVDQMHDLMHKAVGWMLREAGKREPAALRDFLTRHAATMPRTALRYAIEKFDEVERQRWLKFGH